MKMEVTLRDLEVLRCDLRRLPVLNRSLAGLFCYTQIVEAQKRAILEHRTTLIIRNDRGRDQFGLTAIEIMGFYVHVYAYSIHGQISFTECGTV